MMTLNKPSSMSDPIHVKKMETSEFWTPSISLLKHKRTQTMNAI